MIRDRRSVRRSAGLTVLLALVLLPSLVLVPSLVLAQEADHLLISEVVALTRNPVSTYGSPFIEVTNPTDAAIDLEDVYLSNSQNVSLGQLYWNIVTGVDQGGGASGNFHCRFPVGMSLGAGESLVISINGSDEFAAAYGYLPHLELFEDGLAPDTVAEMREAFPGGISAGLGNSGSNTPRLESGSSATDSIVLYRWDGQSDLVTDLDYLAYGESTNVRVDKTGVAIDGPDDGDGTTAYAADTAVGSQAVVPSIHTYTQALARADAVENGEAQSGGNGVGGDDETSETLSTSWQIVGTQDPAAAPASYQAPAPIVTAGSMGDPYAGYAIELSLTALAGDGIDAMAVHYRVDGGSWQQTAGSEAEAGTWTASIPAQATGAAVEYYGTITGTGGGTAVWPAGGDNLPLSLAVVDAPGPEILGADAGAAFAGTPCTITVTYESLDPAVTGTLHYAVGGGAYATAALAGSGGVLTGEIPGQSSGTQVSWYVEVEDSATLSDVFPDGAPGNVLTVTFTDAVSGAYKLLITEVNTGENIYPFTGMSQIAPEFVEIHNPNAFAVDMSDYYITDAINYNYSTQVYWAITDGDPSQETVGGGHYNDFTARFPAGFTIDPGQTIVLSIASSGWFQTAYGLLPDIELYEDDMSVAGVPEMRPVFVNPGDDLPGDSIFTADRPYGSSSDEMPKGIPEIEEHYGEPVILYHWDGAAATVTDIDVLMLGDSKTGDYRIGFDKSDEPGYNPDTPVADQDWITTLDESGENTYTRIDPFEGQQLTSGSNGVDGRDETSEDWTVTFDVLAPTPGEFEGVPTPEIVSAVAARAVMDTDCTVTVTMNAVIQDLTGTLYYAVDGGSFVSVAMSVDGRYLTGVIAGQPLDTEVSWYVEVEDGEAQTDIFPDGAPGTVLTVTFGEPVSDEVAKLFITEVCYFPSAAEFVEICNPNDFEVSLANYYLTDSNYTPNSQHYWHITQGNPSQASVGGGAFGDFHSQFPADMTIAAGDTITISLLGSDSFADFHGLEPDIELFEDGSVDDAVPDLLEVFPGSTYSDDFLTYGVLTASAVEDENGEVIILYYWDGESDLVTDIDIVAWGDEPTSFFSKDGIAIDGVDADQAATPYGPETAISAQQPIPFTHASGQSFTRVGSDEQQTGTVGNGVGGTDELSEPWALTFVAAEATPNAPAYTGPPSAVTLDVPAATFIPTRGETFDIEIATLPDAETRLRILDLEGRVIINLTDSRFLAGRISRNPEEPTVISWDGRDQTYDRVRAGMYIVHLHVVDAVTGEQYTETAPVVVATRLD